MGEAPKDLGKINDWLEKGKAIDTAYENFQKKKFEQIIKMEYDAEVLGEKWVKVKNYEKHLGKLKKELVAKEHNNLYCFITINPNPSVALNTFHDKIEKFVNRNMFQGYKYVLEQRGATDDEAGKGFHAHILLKRNLDYKPSKVSGNTKNSFKGITKVDNPEILNIQHIGTDFAKDKDEYITGVKTGEAKDVKQEIDKLWRVKNNLESVYENNFSIN